MGSSMSGLVLAPTCHSPRSWRWQWGRLGRWGRMRLRGAAGALLVGGWAAQTRWQQQQRYSPSSGCSSNSTCNIIFRTCSRRITCLWRQGCLWRQRGWRQLVWQQLVWRRGHRWVQWSMVVCSRIYRGSEPFLGGEERVHEGREAGLAAPDEGVMRGWRRHAVVVLAQRVVVACGCVS